MVIFDCNGVLVDSERLATRVMSRELMHAGFPVPADVIARYFTGRRASDVFAQIEAAAGRKLPAGFADAVARATLDCFRRELRATPFVAEALSWLRGRKCVASSSPPDRIRFSLETTNLVRFFEPHLFSASDVTRGKPAPDLFLLAAAKMRIHPDDCIVVEDSAAGVAAAAAAGMTPIGFAGGSHASDYLEHHLRQAGARAIIRDMRALKATIVDLRGW
jgi:HAD superfamily hydrolase (TIGR01509 family)